MRSAWPTILSVIAGLPLATGSLLGPGPALAQLEACGQPGRPPGGGICVGMPLEEAILDDFDWDGFADDFDNCPFVTNLDQHDSDGDGWGDACDNAPNEPNDGQEDLDGDGAGDFIDGDRDGDGIDNERDNCPRAFNPTQQKSLAAAASGDACNPDDDLDGLFDLNDACPKVPGTVSSNGRPCDADEDLDGFDDAIDNCPASSNRDQADGDRDGQGNACDGDIDGDGILNNLDNSPQSSNPDQLDADRDGLGDVSDPEYCFVSEQAQPVDCLAPLGPFRVVALVQGLGFSYHLGKALTLLFHANRVGTPITFEWSVVRAPAGSSAAFTQASGGYPSTIQNSAFTPDLPGDYELLLRARLVGADPVFPAGTTESSDIVTFTVPGELAFDGGVSSQTDLGASDSGAPDAPARDGGVSQLDSGRFGLPPSRAEGCGCISTGAADRWSGGCLALLLIWSLGLRRSARIRSRSSAATSLRAPRR